MGPSENFQENHTSPEAIREEEILHLQEHALAQISQGVLITDEKRLILYANRGFEQLTGYTAKELIGQNCKILQGPETDPVTVEAIRESIRSGKTFRGKILNYRKDRSHFWNDLSITPIYSEDGRVNRFIGIQRDITGQKRAEEKARESEERFQYVAQATADTIWDWNLKTNVLWWNDGIKKLFGFSDEELESGIESWSNRIHPDDKDRVLASIHKAIDGPDESWVDEYRFLRKDGSYALVLDRGFVIRDSRKKALRMVGGMTDLTENKQQEVATLRDLETQSEIVNVLQEIASDHMDFSSTLALVVEKSRELSYADGAVISLIEGDEMMYQAASGMLADQNGFRFRYKGSLSGLAVQSGQVLLCENPETDTRVDQVACRKLGVSSLLVAPLRSGKQIIGVLKAVSRKTYAFTRRDVNNLQILAESLGATIRRHRSAEQLRQSESQYRLLFQHNPHPMWVYDMETLRFAAVNTAAIDHYGYSEEEFLRMTLRDIRPPEDVAKLEQILTTLPADKKSRTEWKHRKKDGTLIEVEVSSDTIIYNNRPSRLALSHDITQRLCAERELERINRAQRLLSSCNETLVRTDEEYALLKEICQIAVDIGGYHMAWVGYAQEDPDKSIDPVAFAGEESGYLSEIKLTWAPDNPIGLGPAGQTIRNGQPAICEDITQDNSFFHWLLSAQKRGYRGVACFPLKQGTRTFGLLGLYSSEIRTIGKDEIKLLQELADDLAFGIISIRLRLERQQLQNTMLKIATSISAATGAEFFKQLTYNMTDSLGAHAGFVAKLLPGEPASARTLAGVVNGEFQSVIDYPLSGTPCERVREGKICIFKNNLQQHFPLDQMLGDLKAESYVGTPLVNTEGKTLGLIAVLFTNPLEQTDSIVSMLQIFASRAASEMERQEADVRVREQAALLDKAQDAILVRNLEHGITYWNKSAERVYGWTTEEALGRSVLEMLYKDPTTYLQAFEQVLKNGEWMGEIQQVDKNNKILMIEGRWTLVRDESGKPESILAINTDITEKKKLEQQFLRAQRMESIGTLAGGIAHDLNNVLTPILMCVDILKMSRTEKQKEEMLDTIGKSARRGADMISQVLSFARGVEGKQIKIQALHLIKDIEKIAQDTFPKNIRIGSRVSPDLWTIIGDPTQLHQILLNLCVNARDAMPEGGKLMISAENIELDAPYAAMNIEAKAGPHVRIHIEDTGTGIPRDIIDKIFDPFFTTKELGHGTGLGLSTSMAIVKSHGGFIRVYSEAGNGASFSIYLPAQTEASGPDLENTIAEFPRGQGETILVVDDEPSIRQVTGQTLEAFGYRVLTATDGAKAVATYATHRAEIAAVLMDMMMPIMDGPSAIQVLMKMNPGVKIIAVSGISLNGSIAKVVSGGVKDFLPKPYTSEGLLQALKRILTGQSRQVD